MTPDGVPDAVRAGIALLAEVDSMFELAPLRLETLRGVGAPDEVELMLRDDSRHSALSLAVAHGFVDDSVFGVLAESRAGLADLWGRLARRTEAEWADGRAARHLDPLDVGLLLRWSGEGVIPLVFWLCADERDRETIEARFGAFAAWLAAHLEGHSPDSPGA